MLAHPVALGAGVFWLSACRAAGGPTGATTELSASLVVCGRPSAVIGTGRVEDQAEWVDTVCSLVDAEDLGWIVLTSDDPDDAGGLAAARSAFSAAAVAAPWPAPGPGQRWRKMGDGDELDLEQVHIRFLGSIAAGGRRTIAAHIPERALLWVPDLVPSDRPALSPLLEAVEPVHLVLGPRSRPTTRPPLEPMARS